jgi:uncharacterized membrane protein
METRPTIKIKLNTTDKIVEALGWVAITMFWVVIIRNYAQLPDEIPTHFNFAGEVDAYGTKVNILALPIIASVLFLGLSVLNKFPRFFNYPVPITEANAEKQYKAATRLLRYLKLIVVLVFEMIAFVTLKEAVGSSEAYALWLLPLILGMVLIPVIFYMAFVLKKTGK